MSQNNYNSKEQQDREEILEFLADQWIPVRQMLRTMSRGDSLTNDIFVNCLVREFKVPNRLIPILSKIVLESCRYHDVVHTETLRKKVDDFRRMKQEELEQQEAEHNQLHGNDINNNNNNNSSSATRYQFNNNKNRPLAGTYSQLNREIYQPPRLRPDGNTQEQMELLQFQQHQSSQRKTDRFGEVFDESGTSNNNNNNNNNIRDPRLKNPPLPKTEAQRDREKQQQQSRSLILSSAPAALLSSSTTLPKVCNCPPEEINININNNNSNTNTSGNQYLVAASPRRPQTAAVASVAPGNSHHHHHLQLHDQQTQTPPRMNNRNEINVKKLPAALQPNELHHQHQQQQRSASAILPPTTMLAASHRGCTPKVDLSTRREALRTQFIRATNGVSVVSKSSFRQALQVITPWDVADDEFEELYDNCKQPNGKVHVDDFCHKFVEEYVQNSSSFNASMKPCFATITKSPRYYHHPNLSLSRSCSAAAGGANGNAGTNSNSINNGGGRDLLGRASIVAKAQREKEEQERQARRVVRLTRASELRKEVGAFFRKTVDSYDGYLQCGIIASSPKRRPASARHMASVGSAGVVNYATVHIPEPPLGKQKFLKINTRIEADAVQLGNHPSPRVVTHNGW